MKVVLSLKCIFLLLLMSFCKNIDGTKKNKPYSSEQLQMVVYDYLKDNTNVLGTIIKVDVRGKQSFQTSLEYFDLSRKTPIQLKRIELKEEIMKHRAICITILLSLAFVFSSYAQQGDIPVLQGPSLGQKSPGLKPEIFAPGIVATVSHEFSCCFSPDGKEFYFTQRHPELNETFLMVSKLVEGVWTKVDVAPFVEKQFSFEPWVTPDNKRLYFQSGRVSEGVLQMFTLYVERNGEGKFAV